MVNTVDLKVSRRKTKIKRTVSKGVIYLVLTALSLFFIFPFLYMFFMSFMTDAQSLGNPAIVFFPTDGWHVSNYKSVFDSSFLNSLKNTMVIIAINLITVPFAATLCAFGFARCRFRGNDFVFAVVLATIMLPSVAIQIPLYVLYVKLGWVNTILPLTVPAAFGGGAMNIFLARQFMRSIPSSYDEAAVIDGANRFQVFAQIYLPLVRPIIVFIMIGVFNGTWNDFMGPLVYLRKEDSYTLALNVFYRFSGQLTEGKFPNVQMATGVMMIIPAALVFFIFQKQLIDGINIGGIKG